MKLQWRVVRQSVATVTDRETREKAIGDRRRADGRVRENTMGHCCALGTLEQCRLPDSVNNPYLRWGLLLDKNDGGCRGATIYSTSVNIHGDSFFEGKVSLWRESAKIIISYYSTCTLLIIIYIVKKDFCVKNFLLIKLYDARIIK